MIFSELYFAFFPFKISLFVTSIPKFFGNFIFKQRFPHIYVGYNESQIAQYMKNEKIDITVDIGLGSKNFTVYTMDLTKKYIDINADYRS